MKNIVLLSAMLFVMVLPLFGQNYIQVIKSEVNIRFKPSSSSEVISQAKSGNIFELISTKGSWYEILMSSGMSRYIFKSLCKEINYTVSLPDSEQLRKTVFLALLNAEDKSQQVADRKYPNDIFKNIDYARSLNDKYKLDVINNFDLQSPIYGKIIMEGAKKNWDR